MAFFWAFFWTILLASLVCVLWYHIAGAACIAESKTRRMTKKLIEEIEGWFSSNQS